MKQFKLFGLIGLLLFSIGCNSEKEKTPEKEITETKREYVKVSLFDEVDTSFNHQDLKLPEGFTYQILYTEDRD